MADDKTATPAGKRPDWIISVLQNKIPIGLAELDKEGLSTGQFGIQDREDYWGKQTIKDAFTDEEGVTQRVQFDAFFDEQENIYKNNLAAETWLNKNSDSFATKYAKRLGNPTAIPVVVDGMPDLNGRFWDSNRTEEGKFGEKKYGIRENAINNYVYDNGKKLTIDEYQDKAGFSDTLKFAKDKNGIYLLDENNRPYLVPVKHGERLKSYDELYSGFSDMFGRYGTGEGLGATIGGVTASIIKAPINVAASTVEGINVSLQAINSFIGLDESEFQKDLVDVTNRFNATKITASEKALNDWTSAESLVGMGSEAAMQLVALMSGSAGFSKLGLSAKASSRIPITMMGMMSAAPIYNLAREQGFTAREAATLFTVAVSGFTVLAKADDVLVKSLMGKSGLGSKMLSDIAKGPMNLNIQGSLSKASLKSFGKSFPQFLKKAISGSQQVLNNIPDTTLMKSIGGAAVESTQETFEQIWDTSVRGLGNLYSELKYEGVSERPSFQISLDQELESYKQSAVGGALGGAMASPIMRHFYGGGNSASDSMVNFMKAIVNGEEKQIYDLINRLESEGRFGTPWTDTDGKLLTNNQLNADKDKENPISQNKVGAKIFTDHVKALVKVRDELGLDTFKPDSKNKLSTAHQKALTDFALAAGFFNANDFKNIDSEELYSRYSTMGRDAGSLAVEITTLDGKITAGNEGNLTDDVLDELKTKRDRLKKKLDNITTGKATDDYINEIIYNFKSFSADDDVKDYQAITGKSFANLNGKLEQDVSNTKSKINAKVAEQEEANNTATLTSFEGVSKTRKSGLIAEAISEQTDAAKKLYVKSELSEEAQNSVSPDELMGDEELATSSEGKAYAKATKVLNELQKYVAADDIKVVTPDDERGIELMQYLNMTKADDKLEVLGADDNTNQINKVLSSNLELDTSTGEAIDDILNIQLEEFSNSMNKSGTPQYSNIDAPKDMLNSIANRRAQLKANYKLNGFNGLPKLTEEEFTELNNALTRLEEQAMQLYMVAQNNLTNPEVAINAAALYKLNNVSKYLDNISTKFQTNDEHASVAELINVSRPVLNKALEDSDITGYLKELNKLEDAIYEIYASDNNNLKGALDTIKPESFENTEDYINYKNEYDYFYGIVSLKSSDFYDLYYDVLKSSNMDGNSPSVEQRLIVKEAAQKLAISGYDIEIATSDTVPGYDSLINLADGDQNVLGDSIYIDGSGGTGKTSIVQPLIAGIISKFSNGKIFATSVDKGNKISNIRKINNDFGGLDLLDNVATIDELLDNPKKLKGVSVIVFDEATLLNNKIIGRRNEFTSTKEELLLYGLKDIQIKVNAYNEGKTKDRLKIIYTGDSNQNTQNQDNDRIFNAISDKTSQYLPRTDRLTFSFRQQNQDLKALADYIKASHDVGKIPKTNISLNHDVQPIKNDDGEIIATEKVGVNITKDQTKFDKAVKNYIASLTAEQIKNTVYITDKDDVPGYVTESGMRVTNSIYAQGEEWDNVIIDLQTPLFSDNSKNYGVKKEYYTAITRAKKYLIINLPNVDTISSKVGKVYAINPLTLDTTKESELDTITEILNRNPEAYQNNGDKKPIVQNKPESTPEDHNKFKQGDDSDFRVNLTEFLKNYANDSMQFHTFFTTQRTVNGEVQDINDVHNAKKKFLYDNVGVSEYGHRLVIARQGSPEYKNVVRPSEEFDNQYAIFLESYDKSNLDDNPVKSTVIGVLGDTIKGNDFKTQLNEFIIRSGVFANGSTDTISIPIDRSLFMPTDVRGASDRKVKGNKAVAKTLKELKEASDGITFGTIRILKDNILNEDGSIKYRRGEAFIPASYRYNKERLDEILDSYSGNLDNETRFTPVFINGQNLSSTQMLEMFNSDEDGFFRTVTIKDGTRRWLPDINTKTHAYALSTKLGSMYASVFGRFTISGKGDKNQREESSYWNIAFEKLYADAVNAQNGLSGEDAKAQKGYVEFLNRHRLFPDSDIINPDEDSVKNSYVVLNPGVEIPEDVLKNNKSNPKNSKPYFFFQEYLNANANGYKTNAYFEKAFNEIRNVSIKVYRRDRTNPENEIVEDKKPFINGFEFNIVASKGKGKSNFMKAAQDAAFDAYDENIIARGVDYVSQPSVNVTMDGLIDAILANEIKPDNLVEQTNPTIEDGDLDDEGTTEIGGDNEEINNPDPISASTIEEDFDTVEGITLVDFQEKYYPDSNVNHMMEGIAMFKRGIWDSLFNLSPVKGAKPTVAKNFGQAIEGRRKALDSVRKSIQGKGKILLNDEINPELKNQYHASVGAAAFDFLMKTYFPAVKFDSKTNTYTSLATTSNKSNIFNKEKATLLDDTANEMVKTMLFNTKELYEKNGQIYERNNYLSLGTVEDMIEIFSIYNTHDELVQAMKEHIEANAETNPAILSIYHQFYSTTPYATNDQLTYSLSAVNNDESLVSKDMVDGLSIFLRTASAYKYVHVNLNGSDKSIKGVPSAGGMKPNILRHALGETLRTTAPLIGGDVRYNKNKQSYSIKTIKGDVVEVSSRARLSESDIVDIFQTLGITGYTQDVLNELKKSSPIKDVEILDRTTVLLHDILSKVEVAKTASVTSINKSFSKLLGGNFEQLVVKPMVKVKGVHDELSYRNLNGDIVSRLRNKIPMTIVQSTIKDIQNTPNAVYSDNMFVKQEGDADNKYTIVDWVAKDGIKYFSKGFTSARSHKSFVDAETLEFEIFWNFFETLRNTASEDGSEARAIFSPMVYADGSTDVAPVIQMTKNQLENPTNVLRTLFESRKASYEKIDALVRAGEYDIPNIDKDEVYLQNIKEYVNGTYEDFEAKIRGNLTILKEFIDKEAPHIKTQIEANLLPNLGIRTYKDAMDTFYFNWLAISSELGDITLGKIDNFKFKKSSSDKYVDFVKRSKMMVSTRSGILFRNTNWAERVATEGMTPELLREGAKLSRFGKVAYIKDVTKDLTSLDKSNSGKQEIWDGATFTNPISKIFQQASAGGKFGVKIPTVSKPVTNMINSKTGVGTGIKNAEFEITPKILRNGTTLTHKMMDAMLTERVKSMLVETVKLDNPLTTLETVYDYVTQAHFEVLAQDVISNGLQDEIVHEIIPLSSRKYGGGEVSNLETDNTIKTTVVDFTNKGQQLDASHDVTSNNELAMLTQYLNAVGINYKDPETLKTTYAAVTKLSELAVEDWNKLNSTENAEAQKIMQATAESVNKRLGVSYQHRLVNQRNENDPNQVQFNLNDRQIVNTAISQLNSILEKDGVAVKLFGSQYVLHPQSNLIELVKGDDGNVYLKSEVPDGVLVEETGVDLAWASPSRNGIALEATEEYDALSKEYDKALEDGMPKKQALGIFQNALDTLLSEEGWEAGVAEMLLPMSFGKQFFLEDTDLNRPVHEYDAKFFSKKIAANTSVEYEAAELIARAEAMVEDFNSMLEILNVRIPTTGKHSGVVGKIVGFMEESDNSVFVPPMLLFIQGADQDIDKGNIPSYKAIKGVIPMLGEDLKFDDRTKVLLKGNLGNNTYQTALRNKIVEGLSKISSNPKNAVENNSAVDALLVQMQELVKKRKDTYDKDSYVSYLKIRRNNQAGKTLVGIFANAQKAYQTLYSYSKLTNAEVGLKLEDDNQLDRISETFAALINAATDNAKEQILGSLGINESNANMIAYMVMKGMDITQIDKFLQNNKQHFKDLEKSLKYDNYAKKDTDIPAGPMREFYVGGKEIGLLGSSILNTDLPNSAFDSFKYRHKINIYLQKILGRNFEYRNFLKSEIYANDSIAALDRAVATGKASFNILSILNPHAISHPSNGYSSVYKKAVEVQENTIPIISRINDLMTKYLQNYKKGKGVSEDNYNQAMDFVYGLGIHSFLNKGNIDSIIGNYDLSKIKDRSEWIEHFNNVEIPRLKAKYALRVNPNAFIDALRPIENKSLHKYSTATTYGVLDMRNLDDAQILTYDVSFNNPQLLDEADKEMFLLYSLITSGGKHGKGSYAQIFRYNEPLLQELNEFMSEFVEDLKTQPMEDLAEVFDKYLNNDVEKGNHLIANALPYGYSNEIENKDTHVDQELKLASEVEADNVINGNLSGMALSDAQLDKSPVLKKAVELHKKVNRPRGAVISTIDKIITDGSAGIGVLALEAAKDILSIQTGGNIRKGFKTFGNKTDVSLGNRYGLKDNAQIVEKENVLNSDVNVIFGDINDTDIGATLAYANELGKPVLIHAKTNEQSITHTDLTNLLGKNHNLNVILFKDARELRNQLKSNGYATLNIAGSKINKLGETKQSIILDTLLKALTEENAINYNSVTGEGGVAITMDEDNNATYYPNTGSSEEVSNVYFGDISNELRTEIENGGVQLIPTVVDDEGNPTQIDNSTDVITTLNSDIEVLLGIYRNGEFNADDSIELLLNPDIDSSAIADYVNNPGQVFIKNVSWINKGSQTEKSPPVSMNIKGYSSEGKGFVTYHGKLNREAAQNIISDSDKFTSKYKYGKVSSEQKYLFSIRMSEASITHDRLDASSPETYRYSRDNNVTLKDEKKIIAYINDVIIKSNDSDIARKYLESFIVKEGQLYTKIRSILFSHFNDFGDLMSKLSDETREEIQILISQGKPAVHTTVKQDTLVKFLRDAGSTELRPTALISIEKDINSFASVNELKAYIAKLYDFKSLHSVSKNKIFKIYNSKLKNLGGAKTNKTDKTKFSSTKDNKRKDTNKSKLQEVKRYDKVGVNFNEFKSKLEFVNTLSGEFKQSFYESLINLSLNMNEFEFKKASKLLTKLGVDAGTSSEILGRDVKLKDENTVRQTNRPSAHIKIKDIPRFVELMALEGHEIEATTVSLYDTTKNGVSIIDVMHNISNNADLDGADRMIADKLIGQHEALRNHYTDEEIADIRRICTL